ncbi:molybdenum cofactor guanylyltransferase [Bythopirellula goksoeyrii]|uniref:Probable molybdenum cofactor guanylyltransferase n=1 Tax=Bythopirellula goksoeyrii TaxID=1400387 RepID=A0A5B9QFH6_9BACT|nr:molybdenum cofactor guanylyltransferase [Bythopirellula goksoeyrii]QEG33081.1 putative molybdenum cofactor guanylyltransferase [Bythopirellula goksoeyrii]
MNRGAIILCGGQSERMGTDKALLPFGDETLLERVVRLVSKAVDPHHIVVVAATGQQLPELPREVSLVRDQQSFEGPLAALAAGMRKLEGRTAAVFATGCDTPLLEPAVIDQLFAELGEFAVVVPQDTERFYPLSAVYSMAILAEAQRQLVTGGRSLHGLVKEVSAHRIPLECFRAADPRLASFVNINTQTDYEALLAKKTP